MGFKCFVCRFRFSDGSIKLSTALYALRCGSGLESLHRATRRGHRAPEVGIKVSVAYGKDNHNHQSTTTSDTIMARFQLITGSLLLLAIVVAQTQAEAPRRLRFNPRQRQTFARQEVVPPTPYPSAAELKPEEPALIYGPPPSTDVNELPVEEEPPVNSFQPEAEPESEPEAAEEAEEIDTDESSLEVTTPAPSARLRLRSRQRFAKLKLKQTKQIKRQRIARLEELPVAAAPVAVAAPVASAVPAPQFYYINAQQQPYVVALNAQQLNW